MTRTLTTPNGQPLDTVPTDIAAARAEMAEAMDKIKGIDAQLGGVTKCDAEGRPLSYPEYQAWRGRAKHARAIHEQRYRFLKAWVRQQSDSLPPDALHLSVPAPRLLRQLAGRVGVLEGCYIVVRAYVDDPDPAHWTALLAYLDSHRAELDAGVVAVDSGGQP